MKHLTTNECLGIIIIEVNDMTSPGTELANMLKHSGMPRKELAQRTGVTEKHISTVISGERGISSSFAHKLGYVFESAEYWLDLQARYDAEQLRIQEENEIDAKELSVLRPLHDIVTYFIERGYMHNDCSDVDKVLQLRSLLNISNLCLIPNVTYNAAYRAQLSCNYKVDSYVLFAWQRLCEKETESIETCGQLDKQRLQDSIPYIKQQMFEDINQGIRGLQDLMASCGIAFQVVKNFRGAPVQGFIKEMNDGRIILCLTIRGKRADTFWFTLFHEIAHILYGDYSVRFVDFDSLEGATERRADTFAGDTLIAPTEYRRFLHTVDNITWTSIEEFAREIHVQPYIVLGRLQKDGIIDWSQYNNKVVRYMWA